MIEDRGTQSFWIYIGAFVTVTLAYFSTASDISAEWTYNSPYSHGLLALGISFWIVWEKRGDLVLESKFSFLPLVITFGGSALWLVGMISNTFLFSSVGLLGALVGVCWSLFSWQGLITLTPALGSILLVLPIWGALQWPLQLMSIYVTEFVLDILGIPTLREGIYFTVPGGKFAVEPACSGLGFLLCSVLLGIVYSHFNNLSLFKAARLLVFATLLALFSNWIRIVIIMVVGNATNMDHPVVNDHLFFGWIVFAIALIPFYWVANLSSSPLKPSESVESAIPLIEVLKPPHVVLLAVVVCLPLTSFYLESSRTSTVGSSDWIYQVIDAELGSSTAQGITRVKPTFIGSSEISTRHYRVQNKPVAAMIVRYDEQAQGEELIFVHNSLFDKDRWQADFRLGDERNTPAEKLNLLGSGNNRREIYFWYVVGDYVTPSPLMAKLLEVPAFFRRQFSVYQVAFVVDNPTATTSSELEIATARVFNQLKSLNEESNL